MKTYNVLLKFNYSQFMREVNKRLKPSPLFERLNFVINLLDYLTLKDFEYKDKLVNLEAILSDKLKKRDSITFTISCNKEEITNRNFCISFYNEIIDPKMINFYERFIQKYAT